jgi:hypothetical protein
MSIEDLRTEYTLHGLLEHEVDPDPLVQFGRWFNAAVDAGLRDPNAMTLATVDGQGRPNARIVLLKGADPDGFRFFTNYHSAKGRELDSRPEAALVFFWSELERQVRVEGSIERLPADESDRYFASRPRASRIGAWASEQRTARSRARPTGAATCSARGGSSSGRAARRASTTACSTSARAAAGRSRASRPEPPPSSRRRAGPGLEDWNRARGLEPGHPL